MYINQLSTGAFPLYDTFRKTVFQTSSGDTSMKTSILNIFATERDILNLFTRMSTNYKNQFISSNKFNI